MDARQFYIAEELKGHTEAITCNPDPDYNQWFYQQIFNLMENYAKHKITLEE